MAVIILQINRSTYYNKLVEQPVIKDQLSPLVRELFIQNRSVYGTRKLKVELQKLGYQVSSRRIGRIMHEQGLISKYTIAQYKPQKTKPNEENIESVLDRKFDDQKQSAVTFDSLKQLSLELSDYVNWFNNIRIHSSLNYMSPARHKLDTPN